MTTVITGPRLTGTTPPRPTGPNAWLVIGGVLTALLLAAGTLSTVGWLNYRTETQQQVYYQDAATISIDMRAGDITLVPGEPGQISVSRRLYWSFDKPTFSEQWDGTTFRVRSDCSVFSPGPGCGVDYTLGVPAGVTVHASTGTGDVTVRDIEGELSLDTSTGDITVVGAAGPLLLHTSTGDIHVTATSPEVDASTSTGDISLELRDRPSVVTARTGTGDVHITVPEDEGYRVRAETGTGDIRIAVRQDDDSPSAITARTGTGDIDITPGGASG